MNAEMLWELLNTMTPEQRQQSQLFVCDTTNHPDDIQRVIGIEEDSDGDLKISF